MTDTQMQAENQNDALGAYALYALPFEEARDFEAFIARYPETQDELAETEEAVAMLPYFVEPIAPSLRLRHRILAQVYADAADTAFPAVNTAPVLLSSAPVSLDAARQRRRGITGIPIAMAAVFLALTIGLGSWISILQGDLQSRNQVITEQQQQIARVGTANMLSSTRPDVVARGELLRLSSTQSSVLTIDGLPPLAQGKVYQVWFINGSTPVGAGLFSPEQNGTWRGVVTGDATHAQTIAITIEPTGGSPAPTGDVIIKGSL